MLDDPDDVVAFHEAGHAAASYLLRGFVGTVTIEPDTQHAGGTEVWVLSPPLVDQNGRIASKSAYTSDELADLEDAVKIGMAGPVAESLYWPHRTYAEVLARNGDDEGTVVTILKTIWPHAVESTEKRLCEEVTGLLKANWGKVERLAEVLQAERRVDGGKAQRVLQ